jgi:hypothetical protein
MKSKAAAIAFAVAVATLAGCRRADIRDYTIEIPGLTAENQPRAAKALAEQSGIVSDSLKWDVANKTLTLKYDSMLTAKMNLLMAIESAGIEVKFPEKKGDRAGYINTRR